MCSVADRLGGAWLEWLRASAVGGFAGDEEHGLRLVDQAVALGRLEVGVVEPAEVGRHGVDPAAGGSQQQAEFVQRDHERRWLLLGDDVDDGQHPAGPRPTGSDRRGRARWMRQVDNLANGSQA